MLRNFAMAAAIRRSVGTGSAAADFSEDLSIRLAKQRPLAHESDRVDLASRPAVSVYELIRNKIAKITVVPYLFQDLNGANWLALPSSKSFRNKLCRENENESVFLLKM